MLQLVLDLDAETQTRIETAARAANLSVEQWVAHWLRTTTTDSYHPSTPENTWPTEVHDLAGAWPDFPTLEEIRSGQGEDSQRESRFK